MRVRTRIAPSPTGFVHIGTLRTALYNYFVAKQAGGDFLIRIEDTDRERLVEGSVENLLSVFATIGITNDEGPFLEEGKGVVQKGDFGPYIQSERLDLYKSYVQQLLDQGDAYYCFCTRERLESMRADQVATKQTPKYDRHCLNLTDEEIAVLKKDRVSSVVRMKVPEGETVVHDVIRGKVVFDNGGVDDQVLLKSDGFPTYHLAVVVDDHLMEITHIIRGDEWLPSAPKHVLLYEMFDWDLPLFAHLPLLLNPDKSKLSKRQGDVAVEDYLKKGYLPETLINFVGTLGFNPSGEQELYSMDELIEKFDLAKVNKSGAVLNMEKLDWMNAHYIATVSPERFFEVASPFVELDLSNSLVQRALLAERSRVSKLEELQGSVVPYLNLSDYSTELLVWKKADAADAKLQLETMLGFLREQDASFFEDRALLEQSIISFIKAQGLQNGNVLWPLRVALSGQERSSSPFDFIWALGLEEVENRIDVALKKLV